MPTRLLSSPDWYRALNLRERVVALPDLPSVAEPPGELDAARRRLTRWRDQFPFTDEDFFFRRLESDGITEDQLLYLLGESAASVRDRLEQKPLWLRHLGDAVARNAPAPNPMGPGVLASPAVEGFVGPLEWLLADAHARLNEGVQARIDANAHAAFAPEAIPSLAARLPEQLTAMVIRTLVLELNIARLEGQLEGATQEERFASFFAGLSHRTRFLALLQEYPVLARTLVTHIDAWVASSLEVLERFAADLPLLHRRFSPDKDPGRLVCVRGGAGDTHRGGRSVMILELESGLKLVYKPRSLAMDVHFQALLAWMNDRGAQPEFKQLDVLDRGDYGWVAFVEPETCTTRAALERFYRRQGGYLALLYAIEATDFHSENLIAAGEHPMLVDLESLFQPRPPELSPETAEALGYGTLAYSVLRVGLLPQRVWATQASEGVDLSGLAAAPGQLSPSAQPYLENIGTDHMQLARKRMPLPGSQNRPTLEGADVDVLQHTEAIIGGFTHTYALLIRHRDELLEATGPLEAFSADSSRAILRNTQVYAKMLQESYHPDVLRSALDRDRLFDRLWGAVRFEPSLERVVHAEIQDLWRGDIPIFNTRPDSADIWTSTGERIADYFPETGLELARRRVAALSDDDLARQRWIIRASLATLAMGLEDTRPPTARPMECDQTVSRDRLLEVAQRFGHRLQALALRNSRDVSWMGVTLRRQKSWALSPLGIDLYAGLPGVALFLAHLGAYLEEDRFTDLARLAWASTERQLEHSGTFLTSIGAFDGWGGLVYAACQLAALWRDPALLARASNYADLLAAHIGTDTSYDVFSGAAGAIPALLALDRASPSPAVLEAASRCGERLLECATGQPYGIGWISADAGGAPLCGFSHGAAGIAWALLELFGRTGDSRFKGAAVQAIAYERSQFCATVGNWPDLRDVRLAGAGGLEPSGSRHAFLTAWCHGAAGVGLGRLKSLPFLEDAETRSEIDVAIRTTWATGFGGSHCLCHGDLGNLELPLQAERALEHRDARHALERAKAAVVSSIEAQGVVCGVPLGTETPGLMTGLAGIGYQLLRLADPGRIPSILTLESLGSMVRSAW